MPTQSPIFLTSLTPPVGVSGIYGIINRDNLKIYVGSSVNLRHRMATHKHDTQWEKQHNRYLHRAILKNPEASEFVVIEDVTDKTQLIKREQFWINFYQSFKIENGYNLSPTAGSCLGTKHSAEHRLSMSLARKGKKWTAEAIRKRSATVTGRKRGPMPLETRLKVSKSKMGHKPTRETVEKQIRGRMLAKGNWCPVVQMTLSGDAIKTFESITQADTSLGYKGTQVANIGAVCRGRRKWACGFKWKYA